MKAETNTVMALWHRRQSQGAEKSIAALRAKNSADHRAYQTWSNYGHLWRSSGNLDLAEGKSGLPWGVRLPDVPDSVASHFESALQENPLNHMSCINQIPFQEGFDALYDHFRHSTFEFVNEEHSGPQTIQQYLNLLKSHWLLNVLRVSERV